MLKAGNEPCTQPDVEDIREPNGCLFACACSLKHISPCFVCVFVKASNTISVIAGVLITFWQCVL